MTRRTRGDDAEHDAHRRARDRAQTDITDSLFSIEMSIDRGPTDAARKAQITRDIERLHPFVRSEALIAGVARMVGNSQEDGELRGGITAADVRRIGEEHGIFTGQETGRQLSWIGPAMKRWGLVPTNFVRRSTHRTDRSHGNRHTVYVHPDYAAQVDR